MLTKQKTLNRRIVRIYSAVIERPLHRTAALPPSIYQDRLITSCQSITLIATSPISSR